MGLGVLADSAVESFVGEEVVHVFGDGVVVTDVAEVSGFAIDDLEGDTTGAAGDDGFAGVEGLGDLDFETFTGRELESEFGVGHESVENWMYNG